MNCLKTQRVANIQNPMLCVNDADAVAAVVFVFVILHNISHSPPPPQISFVICQKCVCYLLNGIGKAWKINKITTAKCVYKEKTKQKEKLYRIKETRQRTHIHFCSCAFGVFNNIIHSSVGYETWFERADVILSDFYSFNAYIIFIWSNKGE